ncbi:MAG: hypothetical protein ACK4V2_00505 [Pseudomonadota bacterium]|jgi:ABC-type nickel/cobalt efflux system permease component RcnA|nr:hypothetical protein [Alphaproteobacteria bacterium]
MKKYIGLALVTFFGTATVSSVFAPTEGHKGKHEHGHEHKHDGNHPHGHPGAQGTAAPASGQSGTTQK